MPERPAPTRASGDAATRTIAGLGLDEVLAAAHGDDVDAALAKLVEALAQARSNTAPEVWARVLAAARAHPLRAFLHLEPFTMRCYARPGGRPGDAEALDMVLRPRGPPEPLPGPVAALHRAIVRGQTARALRFRRDALARSIEDLVEKCDRPPRILAAGAGHLREWDHVLAFGAPLMGQIVAFDSDLDAIDRARREYPSLPIEPHAGTVRELLLGAQAFEDLDLAYCSGLLETLERPAATALASALFAMLRPGGTLVLTQFLDGLTEGAFLEAFMDWHMVYRTPSETVALVEEPIAVGVRDWSYAESPEGTLALVTLRKR